MAVELIIAFWARYWRQFDEQFIAKQKIDTVQLNAAKAISRGLYPRSPSNPGTTKYVGVGGEIDQTSNLLIDCQTGSRMLSSCVVGAIAHQDLLIAREVWLSTVPKSQLVSATFQTSLLPSRCSCSASEIYLTIRNVLYSLQSNAGTSTMRICIYTRSQTLYQWTAQ